MDWFLYDNGLRHEKVILFPFCKTASVWREKNIKTIIPSKLNPLKNDKIWKSKFRGTGLENNSIFACISIFANSKFATIISRFNSFTIMLL